MFPHVKNVSSISPIKVITKKHRKFFRSCSFSHPAAEVLPESLGLIEIISMIYTVKEFPWKDATEEVILSLNNWIRMTHKINKSNGKTGIYIYCIYNIYVYGGYNTNSGEVVN